MSRLPIRLRLALAFAGAMAVVLATAGTFLYVRLAADLLQSLDLQLRQRALDLAAVTATAGARLDNPAAGGLIERGESFAQLQSHDGRVLESTSTLGDTPLLRPQELAKVRHTMIVGDRPSVHGLDEPARLLATPVVGPHRRAVLVVGATLENRAEALRSLRTQLLIGGPVVLLATSLGGYLLAGAALRPVEAMRRRAAMISGGEPGQRLPLPRSNDELARLGAMLNTMLERLEASVERERAFVADASHELRTPLALLRTELELALRRPRSVAALRQAISAAMQDTERLTRLADDLLLIARSDQGRLPVRPEIVDLRALLPGVAGQFQARAHDLNRSVAVAVDDAALVRADPVRLEQAVRNLLDNALSHATGTVEVRAYGRPDAVEVHVTDEGPGFSSDYLPHAFERFTRPAGSHGAGNGLGLAIVAAIAQAHGGTAHATNRPSGGADLWVVLPRALEGN